MGRILQCRRLCQMQHLVLVAPPHSASMKTLEGPGSGSEGLPGMDTVGEGEGPGLGMGMGSLRHSLEARTGVTRRRIWGMRPWRGGQTEDKPAGSQAVCHTP